MTGIEAYQVVAVRKYRLKGTIAAVQWTGLNEGAVERFVIGANQQIDVHFLNGFAVLNWPLWQIWAGVHDWLLWEGGEITLMSDRPFRERYEEVVTIRGVPVEWIPAWK
jgi:hypothetical protein